jgi:hypothetical protein
VARNPKNFAWSMNASRLSGSALRSDTGCRKRDAAGRVSTATRQPSTRAIEFALMPSVAYISSLEGDAARVSMGHGGVKPNHHVRVTDPILRRYRTSWPPGAKTGVLQQNYGATA